MASYTTNPVVLLGQEVSLFTQLTLDIRNLSLLSIVSPVWPIRSNLDELAWNCGNIWAIAIHVLLICVQLVFLCFAMFAPLCGMPTSLYFGVVVGGILLNKVFCDLTLNGYGDKVFYGGEDYAQDASNDKLQSRNPDHQGERWVFINGVAAGLDSPFSLPASII